jgi:hypothetical protein
MTLCFRWLCPGPPATHGHRCPAGIPKRFQGTGFRFHPPLEIGPVPCAHGARPLSQFSPLSRTPKSPRLNRAAHWTPAGSKRPPQAQRVSRRGDRFLPPRPRRALRGPVLKTATALTKERVGGEPPLAPRSSSSCAHSIEEPANFELEAVAVPRQRLRRR